MFQSHPAESFTFSPNHLTLVCRLYNGPSWSQPGLACPGVFAGVAGSLFPFQEYRLKTCQDHGTQDGSAPHISHLVYDD